MTGVRAFSPTLDAEWARIELLLSSWGNKPLTDLEAKNFRRGLEGRWPQGVLEQAVENLLNVGGSHWRPSPAEVTAEAITIAFPELAPRSWTEVWSAIVAAKRTGERPRNVTPGEMAVWVGERVAAELGPIAGSFAAAVWADVMRSPIGGDERGGAIVGGLRREWDEHQQIVRQRVLRGGEIPTPRQVSAPTERLRLVGGPERWTAPNLGAGAA